MRNIFWLGILVIAVVVGGLSLVYLHLDPVAQACHSQKAADPNVICTRQAELVLVLTLISAAVLTLFGTLAVPGQDGSSSFSEQRIRLAVLMAVLVLYLVFFGMVIFVTAEGQTNQKMVETLTNLMMVVLPFYFGASAVAQIVKKTS